MLALMNVQSFWGQHKNPANLHGTVVFCVVSCFPETGSPLANAASTWTSWPGASGRPAWRRGRTLGPAVPVVFAVVPLRPRCSCLCCWLRVVRHVRAVPRSASRQRVHVRASPLALLSRGSRQRVHVRASPFALLSRDGPADVADGVRGLSGILLFSLLLLRLLSQLFSGQKAHVPLELVFGYGSIVEQLIEHALRVPGRAGRFPGCSDVAGRAGSRRGRSVVDVQQHKHHHRQHLEHFLCSVFQKITC